MRLRSSVATKVAARLGAGEIEDFLRNAEARRWGVLLHTALLLLEGTNEKAVRSAVCRAFCVLGEKRDEKKISEAVEEIKRVLSIKGVEVIFPQKDGQVFAERSFLDEEGNVLRPDRVVVYPEKVVIVDFKVRRPLSARILEEYRRQVKSYMDVVSKALGRSAEGYLLFIEEGRLERVEE